MKKRSNALFLACMPVLCVLILLGMGLPQWVQPAVTVGGQDYSVAAYNYYFYEAYYAYATEHYAQLVELGLDLTRQLKTRIMTVRPATIFSLPTMPGRASICCSRTAVPTARAAGSG